MSEPNVVGCRSVPITDALQIQAVFEHRETAAFRFGAAERPGRLLGPVDNYGIAFGRVPDPLVRERVANLFRRQSAAIFNGYYNDSKGYIYVFHDLADASNVVKIGTTKRNPRERIAEWNRALAPEQRGAIVLLYAYPTLAHTLAERVVQETLRCEHIGDRLNPLTVGELAEFYTIANFMALKLFIRQTLRYVNWFVTSARMRAKQQ